jgi:hypothetical protein
VSSARKWIDPFDDNIPHGAMEPYGQRMTGGSQQPELLGRQMHEPSSVPYYKLNLVRDLTDVLLEINWKPFVQEASLRKWLRNRSKLRGRHCYPKAHIAHPTSSSK